MKRFTFKNGDDVWCVRNDSCFEEQSEHYCGPAIERLAYYEDLEERGRLCEKRGFWREVDSSYWRWSCSGAKTVECVTFRCSRCGRGSAIRTKYCPGCGAYME